MRRISVSVVNVAGDTFPNDGVQVDWFYTSTCTKTPGPAVVNQRCAYMPPASLRQDYTDGWHRPVHQYTIQYRLIAGGSNARLAVGDAPSNLRSVLQPQYCVDNPRAAKASLGTSVIVRGITAFGWVGLYAPGAADSSPVQRIDYSSFSAVQSDGTCCVRIPLTGLHGLYNFRLFSPTGTRLTTSYTFPVNP